MKPYENKTIYWTLLIHKHWRMHIAATSNGLCFIGSQNETFEELNTWASKKLPQHTFIKIRIICKHTQKNLSSIWKPN